jgi:hypothetical protein
MTTNDNMAVRRKGEEIHSEIARYKRWKPVIGSLAAFLSLIDRSGDRLDDLSQIMVTRACGVVL